MLLVTLLLSVMTFAGDASEYQKIGFSPDGKYFAFVQYGIQDGSGFPYAEAAIVDVDSNQFALKKRVVIETEKPLQANVARDKAIRQLSLTKYRIEIGKNLGRDLLLRLPTDHSEYGPAIFSYDFWAEGGASMTIPKYEMVLETKAAEDTTEGKWCSEFLAGSPQMLKLSVVGKEATDGSIQVLQDDQKLPASRGCAYDYRVNSVTTFQGKIVVGIRYSQVGFEGPDVRSLIVTGKIAK